MRLKIKSAAALLGLVLSINVMANPVVLAGIKLEETVLLQNTKLQLNGAGIRYKAVFKGFVAGLYLTKKINTPEGVFADQGPKRMSITLLRDVDSKEFSKIFIKGFGDNAPKAKMSKLIPGLLKMGQLLSDQVKFVAGDTIVLDWIPGIGTILTVKGNVLGEPFKDAEFYNALLGIWLGPSPMDWALKDALLGIKAS